MTQEQLTLKLGGRDIARWALFMEEVLGAQLLSSTGETCLLSLPGLEIELSQNNILPAASPEDYRGIEIEFTCADANLYDFHQRLAFLLHRRPEVCQLYRQSQSGPLLDFNGIAWRPRFLQ